MRCIRVLLATLAVRATLRVISEYYSFSA